MSDPATERERLLTEAARYVIRNIEDWQAENPTAWSEEDGMFLDDMEHQVMRVNRLVLAQALEGQNPFKPE